MKAARIIFVALFMMGLYYSNQNDKVEDELSPLPPDPPRPTFSDTSEENKKRMLELIDQEEGEDGKLEETWDPNYIQFDPTYRHYSGDDELEGYLED